MSARGLLGVACALPLLALVTSAGGVATAAPDPLVGVVLKSPEGPAAKTAVHVVSSTCDVAGTSHLVVEANGQAVRPDGTRGTYAVTATVELGTQTHGDEGIEAAVTAFEGTYSIVFPDVTYSVHGVLWGAPVGAEDDSPDYEAFPRSNFGRCAPASDTRRDGWEGGTGTRVSFSVAVRTATTTSAGAVSEGRGAFFFGSNADQYDPDSSSGRFTDALPPVPVPADTQLAAYDPVRSFEDPFKPAFIFVARAFTPAGALVPGASLRYVLSNDYGDGTFGCVTTDHGGCQLRLYTDATDQPQPVTVTTALDLDADGVPDPGEPQKQFHVVFPAAPNTTFLRGTGLIRQNGRRVPFTLSVDRYKGKVTGRCTVGNEPTRTGGAQAFCESIASARERRGGVIVLKGKAQTSTPNGGASSTFTMTLHPGTAKTGGRLDFTTPFGVHIAGKVVSGSIVRTKQG